MPQPLSRFSGRSPMPSASCAALALAAAFLTGCNTPSSSSEPKPPAKAQIEKTVTARAKVLSLDRESRLVVLRGETGNTWLVRAGDEVRNFGQVLPGDFVRVDYQTSLAVALKRPGEVVATPALAVASGRAEPGSNPAGAVAAQVTTTVKIESVDTVNDIVVFTPIGGGLEAARVPTPEGQEFLRHLKAGDRVEITYTECVAIVLEKQ